VYVHLKYGFDAEDYRRRFAAGLEPDASPYGFHLARELGYDVKFSTDCTGALRRRVLRLWARRFKLDIFHVLYNRKRIGRSDIVWTMLEHEALALAAMMYLRLVPNRPIIMNIVWLLDRWERFPPVVQALFKVLLRKCTVITVHSARCLERARELFPALRTELVYFGIARNTFTPAAPAPRGDRIRIVSAGFDRTRDWETLLAAFGNDDRFEIVVLCKWLDPVLAQRYRNLTVPKNPAMKDLLHHYRSATWIVIPMHRNIYSGITVALEAAAMGIPVVSSDTGGVSTYFNEQEVLYVPAADPEALREATLRQSHEQRERLAKQASDRFERNDYSTMGLMRRYSALTEEVFAQQAATHRRA
jgi:glycosyltransferase involved in cell wall biosynthesis